MNKLLLTLLLVIVPCASFSQNWTKIPMQFSTGDTFFYSWEAAFVSKNVGWYVVQSVPSKIFKTTDGGHRWDLKSQSRAGLFQLFALDSLHVWMRSNHHVIKFSSDGGESWDSTYTDSSGIFSIGPIYFFDPLEGFLFGSKLFHSIDGGKSWQVYNSTDTLVISNAEFVSFVNKKNAWMTGVSAFATDAGSLGATSDSGRTWSFQREPMETEPMNGITFLDTLSGYAVGNAAFGANAVVYSTTDGGLTWPQKIINGVGHFPDIGFLNKQNGWVTGFGGRIWNTIDSGTTWNLQQTSVFADLKKICVLRDEGIAYVFGDSNTLLYADITTDVKEIPSDVPLAFSLSQNYPNPFNPQTTIEYTIAATTPVKLKIYNLLGDEVKMLVDDTQHPGKYQIRWSGLSNVGTLVPSGLYVYQLIAGERRDYRKMSFIK
jgi:photosystem II stability/assembly factor-like uncharacterized protein